MGLADGMASEQEYGIKEKLNIPVSDDYIINGSGLFHWNSSIKKEVKLKMVEWYNNLSSEERQYVDDLRHEAAMEEYDSHCGAEL